MGGIERIRELVKILNRASETYYSGGETIMSDFEYDKLYDELSDLEKKTGYSDPESPTRNVGFEAVGSLVKVRHETRMLSLDKTKDISRLEAFLAGGQAGLLSYKLDGLTVVTTYENGRLARAVTRGNGDVGEDITHNAKTFANVPKTISYAGRIVIRGEAVISYADFDKINESLPPGEKYKNPRNLCSGTVRQLDSSICAGRNVRYIVYTIISADSGDFPDSKAERLSFLEKQGFRTVEHASVTAETVHGFVKDFTERAPDYGFAADGLVLTYDSVSYGASLGETSKFPRDSIAFKWADETRETILLTVEWNASRTGLINPVAVFSPVELEGTTVNRASLHNVSVVKSLKLGLGDKITVYKANMVIPQIAENLTKSDTLEIPSACPVCGEKTKIAPLSAAGENDQSESLALFCENPGCPAKRDESLVHFCSRDAMDIEGFSTETIKKLTKEGFLRVYPDFYELGAHRDEIININGIGEKLFDKLMGAVDRSKMRPLHNFIYALGISGVGLANAKLLCAYFDYDINPMISTDTEELKNELTKIEGFGEIIADSVADYFAKAENRSLLQRAFVYLTPEKPETASVLKLAGKKFVITGDLSVYENRAALETEIEANGGSVSGSVSKKTSFLINNNVLSESAKNKKAAELGVPVITEQDFINMIR